MVRQVVENDVITLREEILDVERPNCVKCLLVGWLLANVSGVPKFIAE